MTRAFPAGPPGGPAVPARRSAIRPSSVRAAALLVGLAAVLAAVLLAALATPTAALAAGTAPAALAIPPIPDVAPGHPYSDALHDLYSRGILSGDAEGMFNPDSLVTRQQFAKMMVLTMGLTVTEEDLSPFTDVFHDPAGLYPYHYVAVASRSGLIKGYDDGTFRGGDFITRAQAVTMVVRAAESVNQKVARDRLEAFEGTLDYSNPWHGENLRKAEADGLLAGIVDLPLWDTGAFATRGESAQLLYALLLRMGARPHISVFTYGARGDGRTDDAHALQAAIDRASVLGGDVVLPAGEFLMGSTVELRSGVAVTGIPGQTVLRMPARSSTAYIFAGSSLRDVTLEGLTFTAASSSDNVGGVFLVGSEDSRLRALRFERLSTALKLGTGPRGTGLVVEGITTRECESAIFIANLHDSTFADLDLQVDYMPNAPSGSKHHVIYIERDATGLTFRNVVMIGGDSWPLHLYNHEAQWSGDILFDGLTITCAVGPIIVSGNFQGVTLRNFTATGQATGAEFPALSFRGCRDVLADGFEVWGGVALVENSGTENVILRNGIYHGPTLLSPDRRGNSRVGLTIEPSVVLDAGVVPPAR